jgi:hypothetical protein
MFSLFDVKIPEYAKKHKNIVPGNPTQIGTQHQRNNAKALGIR